MSRAFAVAGGLLFVAALLFFAASYLWQFESAGPWSWHSGGAAIGWNISLFAVFAAHHSLFARAATKNWIRRIAPPECERSIYVWVSSVLLLALCLSWQAVPGRLWAITSPAGWLMRALQLAGAVLAFMSARQLDTLALSGVRQVYRADRAQPSATPDNPAPAVLDRGPYAVVRHPIYLGWFLMVWCAPVMNGSRLLFAAVSCLYLLIAMPFEERDLVRAFGPAYVAYQTRVRWKVLPYLH
jgi:protein-S-isoprenylcysteine O-methyltransferase Ste14